jgi:hypothetical protein
VHAVHHLNDLLEDYSVTSNVAYWWSSIRGYYYDALYIGFTISILYIHRHSVEIAISFHTISNEDPYFLSMITIP